MRPILVTCILACAACTDPPPSSPADLELDPVGTWKVDATFGAGTCGADYTWSDGFIVKSEADVLDIFASYPTVAAVGCADTCTLFAIETLDGDDRHIENVTTLEMTADRLVTGSGRITVTGALNCYQDFTERGALYPVQAQQ